MIKYFVNSGGVKNNPLKANKFFNDVLGDFVENPKLLLCYFSQPREDWEARFKRDEVYFKENFGSNLKLELAFPNLFEEQVKNTDAIYFKGGDDYLLQFWLKKFDLSKILEGKNVATSSASSNALSRYFWSCDWGECMEGLGILPIKFIPHYKSNYGLKKFEKEINWDKAYDDLKKFGDEDLPIYALEEGDYEIFEI